MGQGPTLHRENLSLIHKMYTGFYIKLISSHSLKLDFLNHGKGMGDKFLIYKYLIINTIL